MLLVCRPLIGGANHSELHVAHDKDSVMVHHVDLLLHAAKALLLGLFEGLITHDGHQLDPLGRLNAITSRLLLPKGKDLVRELRTRSRLTLLTLLLDLVVLPNVLGEVDVPKDKARRINLKSGECGLTLASIYKAGLEVEYLLGYLSLGEDDDACLAL